ncbi:MAG: hypothetical protein COU47_00145 [Candidatus Niyogibacteria bacterium CG10_big_fil_rev_8_21_14_0_10_46_36]|uniref:Uncharacterized protein n=1 Tax=Candidatus Niyogibacteria bacterium CG10_big_fil_rev_8_21_14_0_10_46_36 TaxID=1974726 RepID=A0A2H0TE60_9BACT|nr:MAG: hypothetical protein COU47_00145 [Candidatus Niyogibacteria bacterium CG10_big_fil_rev_8_21_14_0_10_46_36]
MIPENDKDIKTPIRQGFGGQGWIRDNASDLFLAGSFFLIAVIGFGLGRFSVILGEHSAFSVRVEEEGASLGILGSAAGESVENGMYVGSKNGSVYHLPGCSGALRIAEENKILFSSKEEAESLGYRAAKNCEGI